jgi:hypothetical protein
VSCEHGYPPGEYCPICGEVPVERDFDDETPCPDCDGDGYTERWNDDQSGVVIEICERCQ